jgi:hypothetical protein
MAARNSARLEYVHFASMRRSALRPAARAAIAESVTKARYRCGKTSNAAHQTKASEVPIRGIKT